MDVLQYYYLCMFVQHSCACLHNTSFSFIGIGKTTIPLQYDAYYIGKFIDSGLYSSDFLFVLILKLILCEN